MPKNQLACKSTEKEHARSEVLFWAEALEKFMERRRTSDIEHSALGIYYQATNELSIFFFIIPPYFLFNSS